VKPVQLTLLLCDKSREWFFSAAFKASQAKITLYFWCMQLVFVKVIIRLNIYFCNQLWKLLGENGVH